MRSLFDGPQSPSKTEVIIEEDIHFQIRRISKDGSVRKEGRKFLVEIFYYIKSNVCLIVSSSNMSSFALYVSVSNHPPTLGALPFKQSCNNRLSFIFLQPSLNLSRNTYCASILSLAISINTLHIYTSPFSNQIQRIY